MTSLREPHLGPLVGHTTDKSCRLWIRARDLADRGADLADDRRTIGVLAVMAAGAPIYYFRLRREYDRTGTFNLGVDRGIGDRGPKYELQPDTQYSVRIATLSLDDPLPNDIDMDSEKLARRLPPPEEWRDDMQNLNPDLSEAVFRTYSTAATLQPRLSFLLGSCRYPGILWQERESDQIFGPMLLEAQGKVGNRTPTRFTLMAGDQIYADLLNRAIPIGRADTFEEFQERYQTAFSSTSMRKLLQRVPTYMVLDDHEIEDNWTQDRVAKQVGRELFLHAIRAYLSYQWSHGPRTYEGRLYYAFESEGYPFFVLDTRTQRYVDLVKANINEHHLLGRPALHEDEPGQLDRLIQWMKEQQAKRGNAPKFIVSSSVFVPNSVPSTKGDDYKQKEDDWSAFPTTRRALLAAMVSEGIQNVVFLSGDIHSSNVAEIRFSGLPAAAPIKAFAITSSAFYWPFPFANGDPSDYVHDSQDPRTPDTFDMGGGVSMDYRAFGFTQEDNYCRIDVDRATATVTVRAFDWKGAPIRVGKEKGKGTDRELVSTLRLTQW